MSLDFEILPETGETIEADDLPLRDQRALTFILLYVAEAFGYEVSLESIVDNLDRGWGMHINHESKVFKWAASIINESATLDEQIKPFLAHWRLERIGVCTRLILRMSIWEFLHTDTPATVIINEAIELAKNYAEMESYKFINGILDEFVKQRVEKSE